MDDYDSLIKEKGINEIVMLLVNENKEIKKTFKMEVDKLRTDVSLLQQKIKYLEKQNSKIMKEHNVTLVNKFSKELLSAIIDEDFEYFKEIIETEVFPINQYIMDESEKVPLFLLRLLIFLYFIIVLNGSYLNSLNTYYRLVLN